MSLELFPVISQLAEGWVICDLGEQGQCHSSSTCSPRRTTATSCPAHSPGSHREPIEDRLQAWRGLPMLHAT